MTTDARWSEETEQLAVSAFTDTAETSEPVAPIVRRILTALADAGVLVEPGGQTRVEWMADRSAMPPYIVSDKSVPAVYGPGGWGSAEAAIRASVQGYRRSVAILRRTVHVGQWHEDGPRE